MLLSDKSYNVLKRVTQLILPAAGSLYFGLAQIWGFPAGEQVVGTIALITTFFGVTLEISSHQYEASGAGLVGDIVVIDEPDKTVYSLEIDGDPAEIASMDKATFKIKHE
jgi:hypothetical protein